MTIKECFRNIGKTVFVAEYYGENHCIIFQTTINSVSLTRVNPEVRGGYHPINIFKTEKHLRWARRNKGIYRLIEYLKSTFL